VLFTPVLTPSLPLPPWPPGAFQDFPQPYVPVVGAAAARKLVKLSVVPEASDRWKDRIAEPGSETPELDAVIAGSFHLVIVPAKMPAIACDVRFSLVTPCTL
jgi:hypothetical protein